jgi:hypothetical protein
MVPLAVLCGVMMAFLAGVGLVGQVGPPTPERPYSCRLYDAEQKTCASEAAIIGPSNGAGRNACGTADGCESGHARVPLTVPKPH